MHVARGAGNIQRLADIIALHDRHHFGGKPPLIHQPADPQAGLIAKRNFALHIGQFFLVKLVGGQRFVKLVAFKTVGMGRVQAELRRTHRAPANAIARPVEAAKRPFQSLDMRQQIFFRHVNVIHHNHACHRRTQRHFSLDFGGRQTVHAFFENEPTNFAVMRVRLCPDHKHICHRCVGYPSL